MHERSVAAAVTALALDHAAARRVVRVKVRIGDLRQVVRPALDFAWDVVVRGTPAEGAELLMERVAAAGRCRESGRESELPTLPLRRAGCGTRDVELVRGEALLEEWMDLEEGEAEAIPAAGGRAPSGGADM